MVEDIIEYMRTTAPAALPIFRSEQQMQILGALFAHRSVELSVSELAAATGVAIATASREAERLEAHGIVTSRHVGRSHLVAANWDLPWADALAQILAHTVGLPARLAAALGELDGVDSAYVYGSWAARSSGEVGPPPADVDLLVVGDVALPVVRKALRSLEEETAMEINPVVMSEQEWSTENGPFLDEIRSRPLLKLDLHGGLVA
jgi:DNA-binding transcriptional ArsR family regulator